MNRHTDIPTALHPEQADKSHPILVNLEKYWQALRHAQRIPSRNDIEPRQIDDALPHAFILQRVAPGVARMRVAGQRLHDLLKMDARGMPISTFFDPDAHTDIAQLIEDAFSTPSIVTIPLVSAGNLLRHEVTGTMLLLPLRDGKGETTRILGALVAEGNVGHRPRRFQIRKDAPLRNEPLIPRLASTQSIPRPGNAKRPNPSGPALRIVVNNG